MRENRTGKNVAARVVRAGLAVLLAASMGAGATPARALASEADILEAWAQAAENANSAGYQAYTIDDDQAAALADDGADAAQTNLPAKYDLRDPDGDGDRSDSVVTPVKNQGIWGTCWGFAYIAACETSILSKSHQTYAGTGFDLSELQLVQATFLNGGAPASVVGEAQAGEGFHTDSADPNLGLSYGGETSCGTALFSAGIGPVAEADATYKNTGVYGDDTQNEPIYQTWAYIGREDKTGSQMYLTKDQIDALDSVDGNVIYLEGYAGNFTDALGNTIYTDWTINSQTGAAADDYSWWNSSAYTLANGNMLPEFSDLNEDGSYGGLNWAAVDVVKNELYADPNDEDDYSRAVAIGIYADYSIPSDLNNDAEYLSSCWAQYVTSPLVADHEVTIVGWDDTYPKENFAAGYPEEESSKHIPPGDGAWLVKNSWGSESADCEESQLFSSVWGMWENDANNGKGGHTGYFWVSYYDQTICDAESYDFDLDDEKSDADVTAQYDYLPTTRTVVLGGSEEPTFSANEFDAECDTELDALACWTTEVSTTVTFQVYRLRDDAASPTDGELLYEGSETYDFGGYHRHEIAEDKRVALRTGERYSVVTTQVAGGLYYQSASANFGAKESGGVSAGFEAKVNAGESWSGAADENGEVSWVDWTEVVDAIRSDYPKRVVDNATIKAFGSKQDYAEVAQIEALEQAVAEGRALLDAVAVSGDGSDVAADEQWMTQANYDALATAVEAGEASLARAGAEYKTSVAAGTDSGEAVEGYAAAIKAAAAKAQAGSKKAEDKKGEEAEPEPTPEPTPTPDPEPKTETTVTTATTTTASARTAKAATPAAGDASVAPGAVLAASTLASAAALAFRRRK